MTLTFCLYYAGLLLIFCWASDDIPLIFCRYSADIMLNSGWSSPDPLRQVTITPMSHPGGSGTPKCRVCPSTFDPASTPWCNQGFLNRSISHLLHRTRMNGTKILRCNISRRIDQGINVGHICCQGCSIVPSEIWHSIFQFSARIHKSTHGWTDACWRPEEGRPPAAAAGGSLSSCLRLVYT